MKKLAYLIILLGVALAQGTSLEDTRWTLASYTQDGRLVTVGPEAGVTLEFAQNRVGGQTGCNSFGGNYTQDGTRMRMGPLVQTLMACPDEAQNRLERTYLLALSQVRSFRLEGYALRLDNETGRTLLVFAKARPQAILGEWAITALNTGNAITSVVPGSKPTLTFGSKNIGGNTGCNQYTARYTMENFSLKVEPVLSTKQACPSEALAGQEAALLRALEKVESFRIVGKRLTLYDAEGKVLFSLTR